MDKYLILCVSVNINRNWQTPTWVEKTKQDIGDGSATLLSRVPDGKQ
jgi:hypothetical protein